MKLTSFTDFGLRALMKIASDPKRSHSTAEIASEFKISRNHLTKAMSVLAMCGFIKTTRGVGGGAVLAMPPEAIRIGDVVEALERNNAMVECFEKDGGNCVLSPQCRLKGIFATARDGFITSLNQFSLADCSISLSLIDD